MLSFQLNIQCCIKNHTPESMTRGSATSNGILIYVTPFDSNKVFSYDRYNWERVTPCPYQNSCLVIRDKVLLAVGGYCGTFDETKNEVLTLREGNWMEELPTMNEARCSTAAICTNSGDLIVIGGCVGHDGPYIRSVELLKEGQCVWTSLDNLPTPLYLPSASICGDGLYVISAENTAYSSWLSDLLTKKQPNTSDSSGTWELLPPLPVKHSTIATLSGRIVIIGGSKKHQQATAAIHQLFKNEWVQIGSMKSGRFMCMVGTPSPSEVVVIGGFKKLGFLRSNRVEVITIAS